jgi:hypothetical protein
MKFTAALLALVGSATAFAPALSTKKATSLNAFAAKKATSTPAFDAKALPGALAPVGFFDPLGFAEKADEATMQRYREAELTHGRVAMLATVGFLVGEKVEGSSFLFDAQITGPAITHLAQVPVVFWALLTTTIGAVELIRAKRGWVDPTDSSVLGKAGLLRTDYTPGDIGFDPLRLKPADPEELFTMQTKELQNGRLAMLAVAGFVAQELVDGQGIFMEHTRQGIIAHLS